MRALILAPGEPDSAAAHRDARSLYHHLQPDVVVSANLAFQLLPLLVDHGMMLDWQAVVQYRTRWWPYRSSIKWWSSIDGVNRGFGHFREWKSRPPRVGGGEMEGLARPGETPIAHKSTGHACIAHAITTLGATEVHLYGYTLSKDHFHGPHVGLCEAKAAVPPVVLWAARHRIIARDAERMGIPITAWSEIEDPTARTIYRRGDINEARRNHPNEEPPARHRDPDGDDARADDDP